MKLEEIISDENLDGESRAILAKSILEKETADRRIDLEERKLANDARLSKWSTPVAIALTGLITIGANFLVDWLRAEQAGEQAITQTELNGAIAAAMAAAEDERAANAAERAFQYEILQSELSRFGDDDPEANLKRAESLLFLVRAGLLDGLEEPYLTKISERAIEVAGASIEDLGVPSLRDPDAPSGNSGQALLRAILERGLRGYDPNFLSHSINLPQHPQGDVWLDYGRYSILMDRERPYARLAVNHIDGKTHSPVSRSGTWSIDPRLSEDRQLTSEFYALNSLDRGNLVGRTDITWGTLEERSVASRGSFFLTNATPQHKRFNRRTWRQIEDYVLDSVVSRELRATVFTGPLFLPNDPIFKGVQVPTAFWKLVVAESVSGKFFVGAFFADQNQDLLTMQNEGLGDFTPHELENLLGSGTEFLISPAAVHGVDPFTLMEQIGMSVTLPRAFEAL